MGELTWKRKEYETWDEAFRGLAPVIRQQSVRVAAYTQVLFVQACASSFAAQTPEGKEQIKGMYADLAYKCGMYHQLGKALVPQEYQIWQRDFTEEEQAVYRKYTSDGRLLVATLQEKSLRAKERAKGKEIEQPTRNLPWLMMRETCQQHMERWDGTGYPEGRRGNEISPIAQIVGMAKELDRLASQTKSEQPFEEACESIIRRSETDFSPELIKVFKKAKEKCWEVYDKYLHYTMTLPKTIPLVKKDKDRPMGLAFRPIVAGADGTVNAYQAEPWFGAVAGQPGERETMLDVEQQLKRLGLIVDMTFYFLYEATDALLRIQNCKLSLEGLILQVLPSFYSQGSQLQRFHQLFQEQPVDRSQLILTIPEEVVLGAGKTVSEVIQRYIRNGIVLMVDNWHPLRMPVEELKEKGFSWVRPDPELYLKQEYAEILSALKVQGITVMAGQVESHDAMLWLAACNVSHMSGALTGVPVTEDELIRDSLLRERNNG